MLDFTVHFQILYLSESNLYHYSTLRFNVVYIYIYFAWL